MNVPSFQLFEALAANDHGKLVELYAQTAIGALHSVQQQSSNRESAREEKMDEFFFQQLSSVASSAAQMTTSSSYYSSPPTSGNSISAGFRSRRGSSGGRRQSYADLLGEFNAFLFNHQHNQKQAPAATATVTTAVSPEADRLVRDAVSVLSDSRPPTNFVLYPGGTVVRNGEDHLLDEAPPTAATTVQHQQQQPQPPAGPPIFDGSVANATPAFAAAMGGGAGTALHAAIALDRPLILALLMAMGADTRACHTAFRRLMAHEAACNGSIQCLTLLMELGHQYGAEFKDNANNSSNNTVAAAAPQRSPESSMEFPFFPRRTANASNFNPFAVCSKPNWKKKAATTTTNSNGEQKQKQKKKQTDVLSTLRLFQNHAMRVASHSMTELDAARELLQQATLSEMSKLALARQSGHAASHLTTSTTAPTLLLFRSPAHHHSTTATMMSNSDGHGNTPLHWAAFKNETACVSLLLKYHADPNARAHPSGWTPLHDAAYSNGTESIALLLDAGATVDSRANSGATPLCFAAQEDAAEAAQLLLERDANLATRCAVGPVRSNNTSSTAAANNNNNNNNRDPQQAQPQQQQQQPPAPPQSRFSGYTPLHYCAHYNAHKAAKVLLRHPTSAAAMEITDLNDRLPIHVAVARGSSDVLRELLVAGARVETRSLSRQQSASATSGSSSATSSPARSTLRRLRSAAAAAAGNSGAAAAAVVSEPSTPRREAAAANNPSTPPQRRGRSDSASSSTPVSSPVLRSMIPSQPIQSSKPWNCLSQRSIDECRDLITEVEQNWTPDRHSLFTPADRRAVAELLRVGKRLEGEGTMTFSHLWPEVLSFCGRGWFEFEEDNDEEGQQDETESTDIDLVDASSGTAADDDTLALPTLA